MDILIDKSDDDVILFYIIGGRLILNVLSLRIPARKKGV